MKNFVKMLSLMFALNALPALAEGPDLKETNEAGGALIEKKPEKVAPKKKAAKANAEKPAAKIEKASKATKAAKRSDGLEITDVKEGTGMEAKLGSKITVHYKGTLMSGKVFDSSYDAGEPISFELLEGRLIKGWTEGIPGMKVGGKRKLHIPYALAYGDKGTPGGPIPPKSDLNFEVELIKVE